MALSRGMNQEASQDTDLGLLDATLMQNLQDRFAMPIMCIWCV